MTSSKGVWRKANQLFKSEESLYRNSLNVTLDCLAFQESLKCCLKWKEVYTHTSKVHNTFSEGGWVLDESSIFAEIDAFIQRCKDLMEVAEGQVHFGR